MDNFRISTQNKKLATHVFLTLLVISFCVSAWGESWGYFRSPKTFHCPEHQEIKANEIFHVTVGQESVEFCGFCVVDFIRENLPELYEVDNGTK